MNTKKAAETKGTQCLICSAFFSGKKDITASDDD